MSAIALIAAAPLTLVQASGNLPQAPIERAALVEVQAAAVPQPLGQAEVALVQAPIERAPMAPAPAAPVAQPLARAEVAQLAPQAAFAQSPATATQPIVMSYRLAAEDPKVQGPPAPDPLANDIAWANGQTAQHRAEVAREGWHKVVPYEIAWQVLNALDLAQTLDCTHREDCHEANPILGHRPSDGLVIGVKGGMAVLHFLLMRHIAHRNWKTARAAELGTILVQGVIDGLNFRYAFK